MHVVHNPSEYFDSTRLATPKSHVIFTAHFTNATDSKQVYALKTERRTNSTCSVSLMKSYTIGVNVDIKLTPPNPIIEANAGFHGEMSMEKGAEETFEEELTWTVDNQITVPPGFVTQADLVIKEDNFTAAFKTESRFDGKIHVNIRSKKDNSVINHLTATVREVFTQDKGFSKVDKTGSTLTTVGKCKCRFGVEQHVKLTQRKLQPEAET
ncbi:hypothetical protein LOTGIDRAFT_103152 [Lottia gigantea]|uniref:Uncharacterized protein n=1 Tax=Lottia gigantea TaxID=225164 RepID=V4B567_LOTGI|nr:hypothetical protein LOTGIDRAFT_103152 [Lottia gigantea]ESP05653.1 hypothetical protein LOTGIDRAFT_103152 [Lottia gigantea]